MKTSATTPLAHWEGEPVRVWEAVWAVPRLEVWEHLTSTNDRVRALAAEGAPHLATVIAEAQTAGRGREGRRWESPAGLGLWLSVLLRLASAEARMLAPVLLGVAVCRAVCAVVPGAAPRLKWPNDVLLGGRKVSGILCEGSGEEGVVAGVGVNVRQAPADFPPDLRDSAISLEIARGAPVVRGLLAGRLLTEIRALLGRPVRRLEGDLAEEVAGLDVLRGRSVVVSTGVRGRAAGIDPGGALLVEGDGAVRRIVAGSVRPVP